MSASTQAALKHLKRKKPLDGWSIDTKRNSSLVRLMRRNVPLTETFYLDLHYDPVSDSVVGILARPNKDGVAQAQVLVDSNGKPTPENQIRLVSVSSYTREASSKVRNSTSRPSSNSTAPPPAFSDDQNKEILKYAAMIVGGMILMRIIFQAMTAVYILVPPVIYLYLLSTCPAAESFDAKKEIKRVLRGHHLPEGHPDKPRGFWSESLARINASVTTELATGMGYEVSMTPLAGAAIVACARVPAANMDCYWIGAAKKWWYVYSAQVADE